MMREHPRTIILAIAILAAAFGSCLVTILSTNVINSEQICGSGKSSFPTLAASSLLFGLSFCAALTGYITGRLSAKSDPSIFLKKAEL